MNSAVNAAARVKPRSGRRLKFLDVRVRRALGELAARYAPQGVRLFLFGSVARTWPLAADTADLDLGYEMMSPSMDADGLRRRLERDVESLPTVRPVDLVDFSSATSAFRAAAEKEAIELKNEPVVPAAS